MPVFFQVTKKDTTWLAEIAIFWIKVKVLITQLCLPLCDPVNYSPPGSSVHWISRQRY